MEIESLLGEPETALAGRAGTSAVRAEDIRYRLQTGINFTPVNAYPEAQRDQLGADPGDHVLSRPGAREGHQLVSPALTRFLQRFDSPQIIAQVVLDQASEDESDPEEMLQEVFPLLSTLVAQGFLIRDHGDSAVSDPLEPGSRFRKRYEVVECLRQLEDTEIYILRDTQDENQEAPELILKLGHKCTRRMVALVGREAAVLQLLQEMPMVADYIDHGEEGGRPFLIMTKLPGLNPQLLADRQRRELAWGGIIEVCKKILTTFSEILKYGVLHGDVHPGNILVSDEGHAFLIDFAQARSLGGQYSNHATSRGAVDLYYEPEQAEAFVREETAPPATEAGQQFTVAAMLYRLVTGQDHMELPAHRDELFQSILEQTARPFPKTVPPHLEVVERVLARALRRDPEARYQNFEAFRDAFFGAAVVPPPKPGKPRNGIVQEFFSKYSAPDARVAEGVFLDPLCSVQFGAAGISFAFLRIAEFGNGARAIALADAWLFLAEQMAGHPNAFEGFDGELRPETVGRVTPHHTISGLSAVEAILAASSGDADRFDSAARRFANRIDAPCDEWDLTLGWAGVTLALALMVQAGHSAKFDPAHLRRAESLLFERAARQVGWLSRLDGPAMIGASDFMGVAHGQLGQIYAVLAAHSVLGSKPESSIVDRLDQIAKSAVPIGEGVCWPRTGARFLQGFGVQAFPGWCNGTAGFAMVYAHAAKLLNRSDYGDLAAKAATHAHASDIAYHDLCCGSAGTAYSQLTLYRLTGETIWLDRAHAAARTARSRMQQMRPSNSLYKGNVGVMLLELELSDPARARMPFFELG